MSDKTLKVFKSPHVWDIEVAFVKKFASSLFAVGRVTRS